MVQGLGEVLSPGLSRCRNFSIQRGEKILKISRRFRVHVLELIQKANTTAFIGD